VDRLSEGAVILLKRGEKNRQGVPPGPVVGKRIRAKSFPGKGVAKNRNRGWGEGSEKRRSKGKRGGRKTFSLVARQNTKGVWLLQLSPQGAKNYPVEREKQKRGRGGKTSKTNFIKKLCFS